MANALSFGSTGGRRDRGARLIGGTAEDECLDSVRVIVGWTLLSVIGFWLPVGFLAFLTVM